MNIRFARRLPTLFITLFAVSIAFSAQNDPFHDRFGHTGHPSKPVRHKPVKKTSPAKTPNPHASKKAKPEYDNVIANAWRYISQDSSSGQGPALKGAVYEVGRAVALRAGSVEVEDASSYVRFRTATTPDQFNRARVLAESAVQSGNDCRVANLVLGLLARKASDNVNARVYLQKHLQTPGALQKPWAQSVLSQLGP